MPNHRRSRRPRSGGTIVAVVVYLVGFLLLVAIVTHFYLIPAMRAFATADPRGRKLLSADAMLLMLVILLLLFVGLLITFRVGRFFRPRQHTRNKPTQYVDAWQEAARRFKMPDRDE